ncbi:MAG: hypothetical protein ACYTG0_12815 [Planctomycetota bacterium]|jgi:hypothetical protein
MVNNFNEKVSFTWSVADLLREPYKLAQSVSEIRVDSRDVSRHLTSDGFDTNEVLREVWQPTGCVDHGQYSGGLSV